MPKKYIDADRIHDVIASHFCACSEETEAALHSVWDELKAIPAANVAKVRHGRWMLHKNGNGTCLKCHFTFYNVWDYENWDNFCHHCGSDMRNAKPEFDCEAIK